MVDTGHIRTALSEEFGRINAESTSSVRTR
jgi:hypothetical protein